MTGLHLSDHDLQEAVDSAARLSAPQAAHLRGCQRCQNQVAAYQRLFAAVARQPQPAFSFDLPARVLAQLPAARTAFPWVLSAMVALVLGVVVAFLVLFGSALGQAIQGLSTGIGAGLAVVAGFFVAAQCLELLTRHRRQMRRLALS